MKLVVKFLLNSFKIFILNTFFNNKIRSSSTIHSTCIMNNVVVGAYTYIGPNTVINDAQIGHYCSIAPNVVIGGMEHDYSNFSTSTELCDYRHLPPTVISDDVWIGAGVYVKAGVKLGKGCIVGSNSTVLNNIPPLAIVVGSPARIVRYRFLDARKSQFHKDLDFGMSKSCLTSHQAYFDQL